MFRDHSRHVRLNVKEPDEDDDPTFQLKSGNKVLELLVERVYKKRLFYVCLVSTLLFAGIVALRLTVSTDKLDRFVNEHGQIVIHKNIPLTRDQMFRRHFSRYYGNRRGYYRYHGQRIDDIFDSVVVTKDTVTEKTVKKTTTADSSVAVSNNNVLVSDVNVTVSNVTDNKENVKPTNSTMINSSLDTGNVTDNVFDDRGTDLKQTITTTDSHTASTFLSTPDSIENVSLPNNRIVPMGTQEISNVTMATPVNTTTMSGKDYFINPEMNTANNRNNDIFFPMATKSISMKTSQPDISSQVRMNPTSKTTLDTTPIVLANNPKESMTSSGEDDVTSGAVT